MVMTKIIFTSSLQSRPGVNIFYITSTETWPRVVMDAGWNKMAANAIHSARIIHWPFRPSSYRIQHVRPAEWNCQILYEIWRIFIKFWTPHLATPEDGGTQKAYFSNMCFIFTFRYVFLNADFETHCCTSHTYSSNSDATDVRDKKKKERCEGRVKL